MVMGMWLKKIKVQVQKLTDCTNQYIEADLYERLWVNIIFGYPCAICIIITAFITPTLLGFINWLWINPANQS
jgi:hypothetical protein